MINPTLNGREQTSAPKKSFPWNFSTTTNLQSHSRGASFRTAQKRLSDKHYRCRGVNALVPDRLARLAEPNCENKKTVGSL
jgi:hypothetical protein